MDPDTCYKFSTIPKSFDDAEADCIENKQGHLASISSGFENSFVLGQPSSNGSCLLINSNSNSGKWSSSICDIKQNYICKIKSTNDNFPTNTPAILTTSKPLIINDCESEWTYYNVTNMCYKVFHGQTCSESEATCVQNGGHLVSIHSWEENVFIAQLSKAGYTFGNDYPWGRYHVLIGLMNPTLNGDFHWSDGSPYDYQNWCDSDLSMGCTTLVADQDTGGWFQGWVSNAEETVHRAFVCQKSPIAHICQN
uniref:C-type lectin domain-containing protein n=1 Tax=Acrobeloides nanus TaxID=290746 RepID=A0A914CT35_9BILA